MRGRLVIVTIPWRQSWLPNVEMQPTTFARLLPESYLEERRALLPELRDARFRSWDGSQGVIVGIEQAPPPAYEELPQAWWCQAVR